MVYSALSMLYAIRSPGELTIEMNPESLTDGMQACFDAEGPG
jgi:hypothetical protein